MQPQGYYPNGGWAYPQGYGPSMVPLAPAMGQSGPPLVVGTLPGQPVYVPPARGRGRGRASAGNSASQNLVTRVKAELQTARSGQVLELARFAAQQLASRSPVLYQQFLAGLHGGGHQPATDGKEEKSTRALVVADRKQKWKALCADDKLVQYWQQIQETYKSQHGANCEVDALVTESSDIDLQQYFRGKRRREELLKAAGLAREGSILVCLGSDDDEGDSQLGDHSPNGHGQPVHAGTAGPPLQADMASLVQLLTQALATMPVMQKTTSSSPSGNLGDSSGREATKVKPLSVPEPPPSVRKEETKETGSAKK